MTSVSGLVKGLLCVTVLALAGCGGSGNILGGGDNGLFNRGDRAQGEGRRGSGPFGRRAAQDQGEVTGTFEGDPNEPGGMPVGPRRTREGVEEKPGEFRVGDAGAPEAGGMPRGEPYTGDGQYRPGVDVVFGGDAAATGGPGDPGGMPRGPVRANRPAAPASAGAASGDGLSRNPIIRRIQTMLGARPRPVATGGGSAEQVSAAAAAESNDRRRNRRAQTGIQVNRYLWHASLDVLSFLPVETVDPFSGVIVTGWGTPPGGRRAYKATILVQDPALDAQSLKVALTSRAGPVDRGTVRAVEDAILTRARQMRVQDGRF